MGAHRAPIHIFFAVLQNDIVVITVSFYIFTRFQHIGAKSMSIGYISSLQNSMAKERAILLRSE